MEKSQNPTQPKNEGVLSDIAYAAGIILAISYPVLAISTGARAIFQLFFKADVIYYLPPALSAVAAGCYLGATIGFAVRRKWAWWVSVGLLGFETFLTFVVGTLSFIYPDLIGRTVWRHFGADYGYFPLFQPILGLIWLFSPPVLRAYGIARGKREEKSATNFTN
ncbi:MAG: hypothetical protein KJ077_15470 [Anaerolineae bacterium]|nr:hypothetical protein [Anaerolineae bacterium]